MAVNLFDLSADIIIDFYGESRQHGLALRQRAPHGSDPSAAITTHTASFRSIRLQSIHFSGGRSKLPLGDGEDGGGGDRSYRVVQYRDNRRGDQAWKYQLSYLDTIDRSLCYFSPFFLLLSMVEKSCFSNLPNKGINLQINQLNSQRKICEKREY